MSLAYNNSQPLRCGVVVLSASTEEAARLLFSFKKLFEVGAMSLYGSRRLSVTPLVGVERQGRGSVGGGGAEVGLLFLPVGTSTVCGTHPFSVIRVFSGLSAGFLW